jgi:hypothetical protein
MQRISRRSSEHMLREQFNNMSDLDVQMNKHEYRRERASSGASSSSVGSTASSSSYARLAFITEMYEPRCWWFEVFECLRKLLLTGLPVFFLEGTSSQIVLSMFVCMMSIAVYSQFKPFLDDSDDNLATYAQWALLVTLFAGLLERTQVTTEDSYNEFSFGVILVFVNCLVLVGAVLMGVMDRQDRIQAARSSLSKHMLAAREKLIPTIHRAVGAMRESVSRLPCGSKTVDDTNRDSTDVADGLEMASVARSPDLNEFKCEEPSMTDATRRARTDSSVKQNMIITGSSRKLQAII